MDRNGIAAIEELDTSGLKNELAPSPESKAETEITLLPDKYSIKKEIPYEADESSLPAAELLDGTNDENASTKTADKLCCRTSGKSDDKGIKNSDLTHNFGCKNDKTPINKAELFETEEYVNDGKMISNGEKLAKTIAVVIMAGSVIGLIAATISRELSAIGMFAAGLKVLLAYFFMRGNNKCRMYLGTVTAVLTVVYIAVAVFTNEMLFLLMPRGMENLKIPAVMGLMQFIFLIIAVYYGVMTFFILANKKIRAYCDSISL